MLCRFLDLPEIPKHLLENLTHSESNLVRTMKGPTYYREGGCQTSFVGRHYSVTEELTDWIRNNINDQFNDIGLRITDGDRTKSNSIAHTDLTRSYTLLYNLDNADGHINIWQEKGSPLIINTPGYVVKDYRRLEMIEQIKTPNHVWYLLNSRILHSVENTTRSRINIQIGFDSDPLL